MDIFNPSFLESLLTVAKLSTEAILKFMERMGIRKSNWNLNPFYASMSFPEAADLTNIINGGEIKHFPSCVKCFSKCLQFVVIADRHAVRLK